MDFKRADRVAGLIKEEISAILQRELRDPRLTLSTITDVKVSDDLKCAKIYFVCDTKRQDSTKKGFEHSKGFIRKLIASRLKLRYTPDLRFYYDESFDYSSKIDKLLKEVKPEDDK